MIFTDYNTFRGGHSVLKLELELELKLELRLELRLELGLKLKLGPEPGHSVTGRFRYKFKFKSEFKSKFKSTDSPKSFTIRIFITLKYHQVSCFSMTDNITPKSDKG